MNLDIWLLARLRSVRPSIHPSLCPFIHLKKTERWTTWRSLDKCNVPHLVFIINSSKQFICWLKVNCHYLLQLQHQINTKRDVTDPSIILILDSLKDVKHKNITRKQVKVSESKAAGFLLDLEEFASLVQKASSVLNRWFRSHLTLNTRTNFQLRDLPL